jgi:CRP-like cAMP-binding protein
MPIATASSLDLDRFGRTSATKVSPISQSFTTPELAALQSCPALASLPAATLQSLAAASSVKAVARGAVIATEGALAPQVVLVARGRLRAVRRAANGREITVEVLRAGELLADPALAPEVPVTSDWEAAEASTLLFVPRDALLAHVRGTPDVALALAAQLFVRLERAKGLAVALALSDVESRVVAALVALARQDGPTGPEGLLIRQRPTQQEIANQIGACRETVSRTVSDLVRRGLLTVRGRSLIIAPALLSGIDA